MKKKDFQSQQKTNKRPNYSLAKKEALEILDKFGYKVPPVDPIEIARSLGLEVHFAEFNDLDKNISGLYYSDSDSDIIYVNKKEYAKRQIFTIAHELGHYILHREWCKTDNYNVLLRAQLSNIRDATLGIEEKEANFFAANLLVPKFMLDKYKNIASVSELSSLFGVSRPTITYRLSHEY